MDMEGILVDIERAHTDAIKDVTLSIHSELVKASPVDTGFFRANWTIHTGDFDRVEVRDGKPSPKEVLEAEKRQIEGFQKLMSMRRPEELTISNHTDYAVPLAKGHSKQAPQGWIRKAIRRGLSNAGVQGEITGGLRAKDTEAGFSPSRLWGLFRNWIRRN